MAHIFKKATKTKGIIVLTHKEMGWLQTSGQHQTIRNLKSKYFIGIHYGFWIPNATFPDYGDFFMCRHTVAKFGRGHHIPLASANFTPKFFCQDQFKKYWDIICVCRNNKVKRLDLFLKAVRSLYDRGRDYRILFVNPSRHEENDQNSYPNLAKTYYKLFNYQERERFTLLRLGSDLNYLGLSQAQIAHFLKQSKVFTLFSELEGSPKALAEALLCGLTVVVYSQQKGSGRDFLTTSNSVQFDKYDDAADCLDKAVARWPDMTESEEFARDYDTAVKNLREDYSLEILKGHFNTIFEKEGQKFDASELINLDYINLRLPAHLNEGMSWSMGPYSTSDIKSVEQLRKFVSEL